MNSVSNNSIAPFSLSASLGISLVVCAISLPIQASQLDAHVHGLAEITLVIEGKDLIINMVSPTANFVGFEHQATTSEEHLAVDKTLSILQKNASLFVLNGGKCHLTTQTIEFPGFSDKQRATDTHTEHAQNEHEPEHAHKEHEHTEHAQNEHEHTEHAQNEHEPEHAHKEHEPEHAHKEHEHTGHAQNEHEPEHAHKEHAQTEHAQNEHQHSQQNSKQIKHSEVVANYQYRCEETASLTRVEVQVFNQFSGVEKINAMWINENNQASASLSINNNSIVLR